MKWNYVNKKQKSKRLLTLKSLILIGAITFLIALCVSGCQTTAYPVAVEPINCLQEWTTPQELAECAVEYDVKYHSLMEMSKGK